MYTTRLDPSKAIYVPRGVGNSFQALEDGTAYTYLANAHWSLEQKKTYTFVNLADPELNVAVANAPRHYILRSSWVIGEGRDFVKTMMALSDRVADARDGLDEVTMVDDQYGRLTLTRDMAEAVFHLLDSGAPFGTYDLTGSGAVRSWADIAREVFSIRPTATATRCARSRPRSTSRTRRPRSARVRRIPPCRSPRSRTPGTTRRIGRKPSRHTSPRNLASKA